MPVNGQSMDSVSERSFEYLLIEIQKHEEDTNTDFLKALLPWSETLPEHIRKFTFSI